MRTLEAVVVCGSERGDPLRLVGGLTLLERLLRQLSALGIDSITVVGGSDFQFPGGSARVTCPVRYQTSDCPDAWQMTQEARPSGADRILVVAADLLVDQRLFERLADTEVNLLISPREDGAAEILGNLDAGGLQALAAGRRAVTVRPVESFETYVRHQRGNVPVHLMRIRSAADVERGWELLFDHVEKRTKDLPATYFDPPLENFLVRVLAPTSITPNQVTVVTGLVGFFVAWLFLHGWLLTGIVLAIFVEVLDGVDGKLARIKRMTSKVGELEHVLDFFYENSWYLALGAYFASIGSTWAWAAAWAICAADVADNLSYVYYARRVGGSAWRDYVPSLDDANRFLRRFRLVAGRRNIYVWLMLPGFALGAPSLLFGAAVAWALITAATHWTVGHLVSRTRGPVRVPAQPAPVSLAVALAGTRRRPFPERYRRSDSSEPQYQPSDQSPRAARGL